MRKNGLVLGLLTAIFLVGCSGNSSSVEESSSVGNTYTVSFDTHGGTPVEPMNVFTIESSPVTTRKGYNFKGWFDSLAYVNEITFPYTPTGDITLHADWKDDPTTYTVSFETNGGDAITPLYGESVLREAPIPSKVGFEFGGWYLDEKLVNKVTYPLILNEDITLYARWINKGMTDEILVGQATAEYTASAYWDAKYEAEHLLIKVRVEDRIIFNSYVNADSTLNGMNDNVEIYLSNKRNKTVGLFENDTTKIMVVPGVGGEVRKFAYTTDNYVGGFVFNDPIDCEIEISNKLTTVAADGYDGYSVEIHVPYSYFSMSREEALGKISMFFAMRNTDSDFDTLYHESTFLAAERRNVWTYPLLNAENKFVNHEVDTILVGDSYFDSQFYLPLNDAFNGHEVYGRAIGGTKSYEWSTLFYNNIISSKPNRIVFNIGVNDVNAGNDVTGENTFDSIRSLMNKVHTDLPNAKIYWTTICDNYLYKSAAQPDIYFNAYHYVNAQMKSMANAQDYLEVIDYAALMGGNVSYFLADGLHPNMTGYNILTKLLYETLEIDLVEGNKFGCSGPLVSSFGFDYTNENSGFISTTGHYDQYAFYKNNEGSTNFTFEVSLTADKINNLDQFPKMGIVIRSYDKMIFYYVDMLNEFQGDKLGYTYAKTRADINGFDFDWANAKESESLSIAYTEESSLTLKVTYTPEEINFYCDSIPSPVFTIFNNELGSNPVQVGLLSFNTAFHTNSFSFTNND